MYREVCGGILRLKIVEYNKTMKDIKCVIFDCDGVLVDSEHVSNDILYTMACEQGYTMGKEKVMREFAGRSLQQCLSMIESSIGKTLPPEFVPTFREKTFHYFRTDLKAITGVHDFIDTLTHDYCVASSGPIEKMNITLSTTGLIEKFRNKMYSSYQINSWKPDPDIFLHAAKEMGYAINECIIIEDSRAGVMAGVKGGFKVFGYAASGNADELANEGAEVFYDFKELQGKLKTG